MGKRKIKVNYLKCPMCGGSRHYFKLDDTSSVGGLVFEDIYCANKKCRFGARGFGYLADEYDMIPATDRERWRKTYWNAAVASVIFKEEE